jgi:catechol 2,3-dioxygenase-like lactoylglutathione lyase family enzyme
MHRFLWAAAVATLLSISHAMAAEPAYKVSQPTPPGYGQKLSFGFTKIVVADMDRAVRFYSAIGMKESQRYTTSTLLEIMLKFDGDGEPTLVLQKYADNRKVEIGTGYGNLGIVTPDIRGLYAKLEQIGFKPKSPPHEMAELGITVGMTEDPDGHPLEIVQMIRK